MSKPISFLSPRLVGRRFAEHAIPLEVLKDLSVLEEMIVEVAKWRFLQNHPERKRSPRGFTDGISLKLTCIGEGSAVPEIGLFVDESFLGPPLNQTYYENARQSIVDAIDAAEHDEPIAPHLPESLLIYFDRIGRSLRSDEAIEFNPKNKARPARLNKTTRRKLILSSPKVTILTDEISLRGTIPELDQAKMTFELQLDSGQRIVSQLVPQHFETVLEAFNRFTQGIRVQVQGIGRYNRAERLQNIETIKHISILQANDIPTRVDELRKLNDGWLEGKGLAPSEEGLNWIVRQFENQFPDDAPLPFLYPIAEGGVQAEWSVSEHEISLEINFSTYRGEWHDLDMASQNDIFKEIDLKDEASWKWIAEQITSMAGIV